MDKADVHLAVRPGQDWALLLAMVKVVLDEGLEHKEDCADLATGVADLRALVADADLDDLASRCDIPRADIEQVARDFATASRAMVVTRTGVSMHLAGTVAEWLGHVLNVITGRMDRPGGRRYEPGYVDAIGLSGKIKARPHYSRLRGRQMVAGAHALSELPDEITTPGPGQIRAMVINCGNPVVSGPDGRKLDEAFAQLDLLVAIDFVQRESHRHAHWLLPAVHWLERDDLLAFTSNMHDEPYVQFGSKAVEPPPGARRGVADLHRPRDRDAQASVQSQRPQHALSRPRGRSLVRRGSRDWSSVRIGSTDWWWPPDESSTAAGSNGATSMAHPHGWVLGPREFGHFRDALRTEDKKVHAAPPEFVERARELLAEPHPVAPDRYPFQLANRRSRHSMNSWLNELPGLHPSGKKNEVVINPDDAAALGVGDGDQVRVFSPIGEIELPATVSKQPRPGVIIVDHGWGSKIFDPRGGAAPESFGANRNLLVDGGPVDPLSQTSALSSSYVGVERIG